MRFLFFFFLFAVILSCFPRCQCSSVPFVIEGKTDGVESIGEREKTKISKETYLREKKEEKEKIEKTNQQDYDNTKNENSGEFVRKTDEVPSSDANDGGVQEKETPDKGMQYPKFTFRVSLAKEDTVPPKLKKLSFSQKTIRAGEMFLVSIEVQRDLSEVVGAQVTLVSPNGKKTLYVDTVYHPSHRAFLGRMQTSVFLQEGQWKVQRLHLLDGASNPTVYKGNSSFIGNAGIFIKANTPDLKSPVVRLFRLSSMSVKAGESLFFRLTAEDDVSGIASIEVTAESEKTQRQVRSEVFFDPGKGNYVGLFRIPSDAVRATWKVTRIDIQDHAGNWGSYTNVDAVLKSQTFSVAGKVNLPAKKEKEAPFLRKALLFPFLVNAGKQISFAVDAKDKESGVRSVNVQASDPKTNIRLQFNLFFNPALGVWEGASVVPLFSINGLWKIRRVQLYDYAGNERSYFYQELKKIPLLEKNRLKVPNRRNLAVFVKENPLYSIDQASPLLKGVNLSPGQVKRGEMVRLYARIEDPGGSGVSSASCTFQSPVPRFERGVILHYNSDTGFYEGNLLFEKTFPVGKWWVSGCYLQDKVGNTASISGWTLKNLKPLDISRASTNPSSDRFVVTVLGKQQTPPSVKPPLMKGIQVAPYTVSAGGMARLFAKIEKGSHAVVSGRCSFRAVKGIGLGYDNVTSLSVIMSYSPSSQLWEGNLILPKDTVSGRWVIQRCRWIDLVGNTTEYSPRDFHKMVAALPSGVVVPVSPDHRSFLVQKSSVPSKDKTPPVLKKIAVAPSNVLSGQQIHVFAMVTDNVGVKNGFCSIKPSVLERANAPYGAVHFSWNPATQLWEGTFRIPKGARGGVWSLAGCRFYDFSGNEGRWGVSTITTIPTLDLTTVLNRQIVKQTSIFVQSSGSKDNRPPFASSLKWFPKNKVIAGKSLLLRVLAEDKETSVSSVSVQVESPTKKVVKRVSLSWNPSTKSFDANVLFPLDGEDGKWLVTQLYVSDRAGNTKHYSRIDSLLAKMSVTVQGSKPSLDQQPPKIKALSFSRAVALAGSSVRVSIEATDDVSGVSSVSAELVSPSSSFRVTTYCSWNPVVKKWEGEFLIPKVGENGIWKLSYVSARDRVGKSVQLRSKDPLVKQLFLTIRGAVPLLDKKPPVLHNLELFPQKVKAGGVFRVLAEVSDNQSGVASVSVQLEESNTQKSLFIQLVYQPLTKRFEASQQLPPNAPSGKWNVSQIELVDKAGNRAVIDKSHPFLP